MSRVYTFLFLSLLTYCTWGQTGSSLSGDCVIPSGENTSWIGWDSPSTFGKWRGTLTPSNVDFSGRTVKEQDGAQGDDTCWWPQSQYPKQLSLTPGEDWVVHADNHWQADSIGWSPVCIIYYRNQGRAPCEVTRLQKMIIDCPSGWVEYKQNWLKTGFTRLNVFSERDGQRETKAWQ